jgi:hypothetical protein
MRSANLVGAKMGVLSDMVIAETTGASGTKHALLADKVRIPGVQAGAKPTVGDLFNLYRRDQALIEELHNATKHLMDPAKGAQNPSVTQALESLSAAGPGGQGNLFGRGNAWADHLAVAERYGIRDLRQLARFHGELGKIAPEAMHPQLQRMIAGRQISEATALDDASRLVSNVFEGPGLQRMLSMVPEGDRLAVMSERLQRSVMSRDAVAGSRTWGQRWQSIKSGTVATRDAIFTAEGRGRVGTWITQTAPRAVGETLSPLGTRSFYTQTIPQAGLNSARYGFTKLSDGAHFVGDRFRFTPLSTTATPHELSRARYASGFYGALATAGGYNTIVAPYNMTGELFGVKLNPDHIVSTNRDGQPYTYTQALIESHYPHIDGLDAEQMPWYLKPLVPVARLALGTPGQAAFGGIFLKPGAMATPVLSNPAYTGIRRVWHSGSPLSRTFWNNRNAGIFSGPMMATGGVFVGTTLPNSIVNDLGPYMGVGKYQEMLRRAQGPIVNEGLIPPTNGLTLQQITEGQPPAATPPASTEVRPPARPASAPAPAPDRVVPTPTPKRDRPAGMPSGQNPDEPPPP